MRNRVFTTGLVVLVGSLVLNVTVTIEPQQSAIVKEKLTSKDSAQNKVISYLTSKGLEIDSVKQLLNNKHNIDDNLVNELASTLNVSSDIVIKNISNKILHKKLVDLTKADTLISLAQSINNTMISQDSIEQIHKLAKKQKTNSFTIC